MKAMLGPNGYNYDIEIPDEFAGDDFTVSVKEEYTCIAKNNKTGEETHIPLKGSSLGVQIMSSLECSIRSLTGRYLWTKMNKKFTEDYLQEVEDTLYGGTYCLILDEKIIADDWSYKFVKEISEETKELMKKHGAVKVIEYYGFTWLIKVKEKE